MKSTHPVRRARGRSQALARPVLVVLLLLLARDAARAQTTQPTTGPAELRILFIGNSYTAFNGGLYKLLPELARQRGRTIECVGVTVGGKSLEWHYNQGKARAAIAKGGWDWVVLQDYSTQPLMKKDLMFEYARKFDADIKQAGAKTAFYLTWARLNQPEKQKEITDAYTTIARDLNAKVIPCGIAWQSALSKRPDFPLHRPDRSHPTADGTYLNACVFLSALLGEDPRGLPTITIKEEGKEPRTLSADSTEFLQQIAADTVQSRAEER